jgi:nitrite reductase/ring-hydroxylating ferredoxin subunit
MFVVRKGALVRAYVNECPHARHPLDWNLGQVFDPSRELLVCASHGAKFRPEDGVCVDGPCLGKVLTEVGIDTAGGNVRIGTVSTV